MKKIFWKIFSLSVLVAFIDQATKFFIEKNFPEITSHNTGIAFGIDIGNVWAIIISNVILIGIVIYAAKKELRIKSMLTQIFLAMILGGGIGNLIDRIFRGSVLDFISIWLYPSFNIADICISVGILGMIIFFKKVKK
ncbi:MAG: signal peptidase II [Candidatus Peregrinibacteria bacterium]|nr:signal peptidase II [Candidatus Peregrinibacteria bacterium]